MPIAKDIEKKRMGDAFYSIVWTQLPSAFHSATPLWLYTLIEAQQPIARAIPGDVNRVFLETDLLNGVGARSQLGWVGGRIVAEVFYGILDEDPDSIFNHPGAVGYAPRMARNGLVCMRNCWISKASAFWNRHKDGRASHSGHIVRRLPRTRLWQRSPTGL